MAIKAVRRFEYLRFKGREKMVSNVFLGLNLTPTEEGVRHALRNLKLATISCGGEYY